MNAKTLIIIIGLGAGSFVAMGMMTKFVVDSNPSLRNVIQFKAAIAEELGPRGLGEVSVRRMRGKNGYELLLKCDPPADPTAQEMFDAEVAEFFLEKFSSKRVPATLKLTYSPPSRGFACSEPQSYHDTEISLHALKARKAAAARQRGLAEALTVKFECRLLTFTQDGRDVLLEVQVPFRAAPPRKELFRLARHVEAECKRVVRYGTLTVVLRPEADALPFFEMTVDRRGRIVRESVHKPPVTVPSAPDVQEAAPSKRAALPGVDPSRSVPAVENSESREALEPAR